MTHQRNRRKNGQYKKEYKQLRSFAAWMSVVFLAGFFAWASYLGFNEAVVLAHEPVVLEDCVVTSLQELDTEPTEMEQWVMWRLRQEGINEHEAWAIIHCESRWNEDAHHVNWNNQAGVDRGLWMISSLYHAEVSNECAYNYKCATEEAIRIYQEAGSWNPWACSQIVGVN